MIRQRHTGEPCPHMPHVYKTEAAHQAHNRSNKRYWERRNEGKPARVFESDAAPLKLKLQRLMATIRQRCMHRPTYAGRGIECRITIDDLAIAWVRDNADQMRRPSIDRPNNDGHYEPSNIRFVELSENIALGIKVRDSRKSSIHAKAVTEAL